MFLVSGVSTQAYQGASLSATGAPPGATVEGSALPSDRTEGNSIRLTSLIAVNSSRAGTGGIDSSILVSPALPEPLDQAGGPTILVSLTAPGASSEVEVDGSSVMLPVTLSFAYGSIHNLSAPAQIDVTNDTMMTFSRWSGGADSSSATISLTATQNMSLSAVYTERYLIQVEFTDASQGALVPSNVTLAGPTGVVSVPSSGRVWLQAGGDYSLIGADWRGTQLISQGPFAQINADSPGTVELALPVYDLAVNVQDIFGEPLQGAVVSTTLPDGTVMTRVTGGNGFVSLAQLPGGSLSASVEYLGVGSSVQVDPSQQRAVSATVALSYPTYVLVGIAAGTLCIALVSRRRARKAGSGLLSP